MNRKTFLKNSLIEGQGIYARENFRVGEPLFFLTGELVDRDTANSMGPEGDVLIQVEHDKYIVPTHPALHINHCCEPTVGIRDDFSFVAIRYIRKGEELTFDYSTTMMERQWTLKCACRSPNCRDVIEDFDLIPSPFQEKYLRLEVVQRFITDQVRPDSTRMRAAKVAA